MSEPIEPQHAGSANAPGAPRPQSVGGIVLAGARAWGESALERIGPRPLLPIAGRPLIWFGLEWLRRGGITRVTICADEDALALQACLGDGTGMGLAVDYHASRMPRGPAGCIRDVACARSEELLVVFEGASLPQADLAPILQAHVAARAALTIVASTPKAGRGSARELKPAGIYVVARMALDSVPTQGYQDIKEMWIPRLHQQGERVVPYVIDADAVLGVADAASYWQAVARTLERPELHGGWGVDYRRVGAAWVHQSARVSASARLSNGVLIGPRAWIEPQVVLLPGTILGPDARVGSSAILREVVTWPGCELGNGAILNRCLLMPGCKIEAGTVLRDTVYCERAAQVGDLGRSAAADFWALWPQVGPASERNVAAGRPRAAAPAQPLSLPMLPPGSMGAVTPA